MTRNISKYILFTALNSSIPFLTMPIMTRYLSPEQYGSLSIYGVYTMIVAALIGFSTLTAFIKIYFDKYYDNTSYLSIIIFISLTSALLASCCVYFFDQSISEIYGIPIWWLYVGIATVFFDNIISTQTILFRMTEKVFYFGIFEFSRLVLRALLALCLVVFFDYDETGVIISAIFSSFVFFIFTLYLLIRSKAISVDINREYLKHALSFGIPLMPHVIFGALSTTIDKISIAYLLSKEEVGLYAVGFAIGAIIKAVEGAIYMAYQPWFFKEISSKNCCNNRIVKSSYLIVLLLLIISFALSLLTYNFFEYYIGKDFKGAINIIPWVAFAFAINGMYTMVNQVILYKEKTHVISIVTILSVFIGLILNYILIKENGVVGAAQALALMMLIRVVIMWIYSNSLYPMGWFDFLRK